MTLSRDGINASRSTSATASTEPQQSAPADAGLWSLTVADLQDRLRDHGLPISGTKYELVARYSAALADDYADGADDDDDTTPLVNGPGMTTEENPDG